MAAAKETEKKDTDDDVLKSIQLLRDDAKSAYDSFSKKLASGAIDLPSLATEVKEMLSLQADLAGLTFQAHFEHFDWASDVDEDLDTLKESLGGTSILPEDAARLKSTILALAQNLREPTDASDDVPARLKTLAAEAVAFIDESTLEESEEEADDEDEETDTEIN